MSPRSHEDTKKSEEVQNESSYLRRRGSKVDVLRAMDANRDKASDIPFLLPVFFVSSCSQGNTCAACGAW
jgi:hypothetical protein